MKNVSDGRNLLNTSFTFKCTWFEICIWNKKASMIIICWIKTPLYLSPYLCYAWINLFQCWHLSFGDRSCSLNKHLQFLSCSLGEVSDLITAACAPMQSIVRRFIVVYKLLLLRARPETKAFSYVIQSYLIFQLKPNFSCCSIVEKHYTIHNEKREDKFSFLQNGIFRGKNLDV